jgi:hypothetical protein
MVTQPELRNAYSFNRPRKQWLESIKCDIKSLGIRNWRLKVRNRHQWRAVVRDAKVKDRTVALQMMMMTMIFFHY